MDCYYKDGQQHYRFNDTDKEKAKSVSLISLASSLGFTPEKVGSHFSLKEMDSLMIYNDKSWYRFSGKGNINGGSQIDFMLEFGHCASVGEAIYRLLEFQGDTLDINTVPERENTTHHESKERSAMVLPPKNSDYRRIYGYLIKTRHLSTEVITDFIHKQLIYEDANHHNIVFLGRDPQGNVRYAGMRGTADIYGKKFKCDVPGNDKNYGVNIINKDSDVIKVFESTIDCMSYIDMYHDTTSNFLVLSGVADNPLSRLLDDYNHIKHITFCLDNDEAADKALCGSDKAPKKGLMHKYMSLGYEVERNLPPYGKDFNESLSYIRTNNLDAGDVIRKPYSPSEDIEETSSRQTNHLHR